MTRPTIEIWDTIHGSIGLNPLETEIVDSAPFQRLHHIRQLGMSQFVYPSGEHSRFAHSLGVMQFATDMFETLEAKKCFEAYTQDEGEIKRTRQTLRIAALLHDVGHGPFSHASETHKLMPMLHEEFSYKIIQEEYASLLDDNSLNPDGITPSEVCDTIEGTNISKLGPVTHQLISSDLDADRMDYLLRDSHHIGLNCGRFNYPRLISSLTIPRATDEEGGPSLGIEEGGLHPAEELLLARYFMFVEVYFHKTRRAFDYHLGNVIRKMLQEEGCNQYPEDVSDYLEWDDPRILRWMTEHPDDRDVQAIYKRQHVKLVDWTSEHADKEQLSAFQKRVDALPDEFSNDLWVDSPFKKLQAFEQADFAVVISTTGSLERIEDRSGLIKALQPISQLRLYCERDIEKDIIPLWRETE